MPIDPRAKDAAQFVLYEYKMVDEAAKLLRQYPDNVSNKMVRNVALEALLVHARALTDFFVGHRNRGTPGCKQQDDILAIDYFVSDSLWFPKTSGLMPFIRSEWNRVNRAVAHLSYERLTHKLPPGLGNWDVSAIVEQAEAAMKQFLDSLEPHVREWFSPSSMPRFSILPGMQAKTCP